MLQLVDLQAPSSPGRRRNTGRKGDNRELAILDTAEELLEKDGFDRMTVEAIAKGAGISRGALYFYFGSKQAVLTALVARTMAAITSAATDAAADVGSSPELTIRTSLLSTESYWREHGRVMQAAVEFGPIVPEIGALWHGTVDGYIDAMSLVLERGGAIRSDGPADARSVAQALCWMTERNYYWSYVSTQADHLREVTETCFLVWRAAIALR